MTPTEVRLKAAELIEEQGWTRGAFEQNGRFCIVGALINVARKTPGWTGVTPPDAVTEAYLALHKELGTDDLFKWNDSRRRKADVLAALRGEVVS